jgi:hypothetical protein
MSSLCDQPTRTLKRRLWQLSREGQALIQETMERAMAQEATENAYHELACLAEKCLVLFAHLQPGDVVTPDLVTECDHLLTQVREVLTRHKGEHTKEDTKETSF